MYFFSPQNYDVDLIFPLWHEAFGDSRQVVETYLAAIKPYSQLFLCADGNVPVSMLFAVKEQVSSFEIAYIYAVATAKSYRNQGLAAKLLAFAEETLKNQVAACILCPAAPSLAAYYARMGYAPWSAADRDLGNENSVPEEIKNLHKNPRPVFTMAKIFDPNFPKTGTFRYEMG